MSILPLLCEVQPVHVHEVLKPGGAAHCVQVGAVEENGLRKQQRIMYFFAEKGAKFSPVRIAEWVRALRRLPRVLLARPPGILRGGPPAGSGCPTGGLEPAPQLPPRFLPLRPLLLPRRCRRSRCLSSHLPPRWCHPPLPRCRQRYYRPCPGAPRQIAGRSAGGPG